MTDATDIISLYETYGGRAPSDAEIGYWQGRLDAGAALGVVRAAIVADPLGQAYTAAEVTALYEQFGGRAPTAAQLAVWRGAIGGGADFTTVRAAILDDPLGTTHTAATVTALYRDYGGRNPSATELATWQHLIGGGADFSTVRAAILADPLGQTHTATEISALYREYGGRAPTAAELGTWQDLIDRGADFGTVRSAILADPLGQAHAAQLPIGNFVLQYRTLISQLSPRRAPTS